MPEFRYLIRRWSYVIILILMSLSLSLSGHSGLEGIAGNRSRTNELFWSNHDSKPIADSLKRIQVTNVNSAVKPVQENVRQTNSKKVYKIIAGSFASHENAILRARQYFSKGYKSEIIVGTLRNGARVELVSIRSFENISEAKLFLVEFQRDIDPSAWLYVND